MSKPLPSLMVWINAAERLPEEGVTVMVLEHGSGEPLVAFRCGGAWREQFTDFMIPGCYAWCEMPAVYADLDPGDAEQLVVNAAGAIREGKRAAALMDLRCAVRMLENAPGKKT